MLRLCSGITRPYFWSFAALRPLLTAAMSLLSTLAFFVCVCHNSNDVGDFSARLLFKIAPAWNNMLHHAFCRKTRCDEKIEENLCMSRRIGETTWRNSESYMPKPWHQFSEQRLINMIMIFTQISTWERKVRRKKNKCRCGTSSRIAVPCKLSTLRFFKQTCH